MLTSPSCPITEIRKSYMHTFFFFFLEMTQNNQTKQVFQQKQFSYHKALTFADRKASQIAFRKNYSQAHQ